jgi:hypothetical protein
MNDQLDLDGLARRAAAQTRAEARAIVDSPAALSRLLAAERDAHGATATPDVAPLSSLRPHEPQRRRPLAIAAAITLVVVGLGWALLGGGGGIDIVAPAGTGAGPGLPTASPAPLPTPGTSSPRTSSPDTSSQGVAPTSSPSTEAPTSTSVSTTTPVGEPFDGFVVPDDVAAPRLDDVPTLLPTPAPPAGDTYVADATTPVAERPSLSQLWVRTRADGTVDAVLHLATRTEGVAGRSTWEPIVVPRWDAARRAATVVDVSIIELDAGDRYVDVWASGLAEAEVVAIAGELVADPRLDGRGWTAATLDGDAWTLVDATWSRGAATRTLTTLDATEGDIDSTLDIARGVSVFDVGGIVQLDTPLQLVDVDGRPGLLRRDGVAALATVLPDGTLVRLGDRDPSADLVARARSLATADPSTWDGAAQPWPDGVDGCVGFFC